MIFATQSEFNGNDLPAVLFFLSPIIIPILGAIMWASTKLVNELTENTNGSKNEE